MQCQQNTWPQGVHAGLLRGDRQSGHCLLLPPPPSSCLRCAAAADGASPTLSAAAPAEAATCLWVGSGSSTACCRCPAAASWSNPAALLVAGLMCCVSWGACIAA